MTRTADRETFYAHVLALAPNKPETPDRHPWGRIYNYREYFPKEYRTATLSPGRQGGGNVSFTLVLTGAADEIRVTLGTIIRGFNLLREGPVRGLAEGSRLDLIDAWRTMEWQDLDPWDALDILQIGLWEEVRYADRKTGIL